MLAAFIIFFREILEVAIILTVIAAATRGIAHRIKWVAGGIGLGLAGAGIVAYFAGEIADLMHGMGQEIFNATILTVAVLMIGWTVVWMKQHAKELVAKIKHVSNQVQQGEMPLYALALVVAVAIWREGSEIVLFVYGLLSAQQATVADLTLGGIAGTLVAGAIGFGLYLGLVKIPVRHFFRVTSWLLILLAAGLAAQATGYLIAADVVPTLVDSVWDSSWLLSEASLVGQILHALIGYSENPALSQLLAYFATIAVIVGLLKIQEKPRPNVIVGA